MEKYAFASALDRNYVLPYSAMLTSFRSKNIDAEAEAFVMHYDLEDDDFSYLSRLSEHTGIPITPLRIPQHPFVQFTVRKRRHINRQKRMSPIAYAKAFLDRFLPSRLRTVVCIDADIIIADNMSEIGRISGDSPLKAVANLPRYHHHQFNSGFMIIDLYEWRRIGVANIAERFLTEYSDTLHSHDQHTLNLIFKNNWQKIDLRWNYMEDFYRYSSRSQSYTIKEIKNARENPCVIHFTVGTDKPWRRGSQHPRAMLYREYVNKIADLRSGLNIVSPG